jgi:hypothetical protein
VLHVWDLTTGTVHAANAADGSQMADVDGIAFSPDGRLFSTNCRSSRSVRL